MSDQRVDEGTKAMTESSTTLREEFNGAPAAAIARALGLTRRSTVGKSARFAYFEDDDRFLVVAGRSEVPDVDLALAYGLSWARSKRLVLALPAGCAAATAQRLPWLSNKCRPELYEHAVDGRVQAAQLLSREETLAAVRDQAAGERASPDAPFQDRAPTR